MGKSDKKADKYQIYFHTLQKAIVNNALSVEYDVLPFQFNSIVLSNHPPSFMQLLCQRAQLK